MLELGIEFVLHLHEDAELGSFLIEGFPVGLQREFVVQFQSEVPINEMSVRGTYVLAISASSECSFSSSACSPLRW